MRGYAGPGRAAPLLFAVLACTGAFAGLGVRPITKEEYAAAPKWRPERMGVGELPVVDLRGFLPKPGIQHPQGSCVGWAVGYACKTYLEVRDQEWQPDADGRVFSPAFLYNQLNGGADRGCSIINALCAVGFDDTRRAFLLMNSWGEGWGAQGYCWVSYDLMQNVGPDERNFVWEAWIVHDLRQKLGGPTIQPPVATDTAVRIRGNSRYQGFSQNIHHSMWSAQLDGSPQALANVRQVLWQAPGAGSPMQHLSTDRFDGPLAVLRNIRGVRYVLPPTFRPNVCDVAAGEEYGFPLSSSAWAEFDIGATVFFKDGSSAAHVNRVRFALGQPGAR